MLKRPILKIKDIAIFATIPFFLESECVCQELESVVQMNSHKSLELARAICALKGNTQGKQIISL